MKTILIAVTLGCLSAAAAADTKLNVSKEEMDQSSNDMNTLLDRARALPPGSSGMVVLPQKGKPAAKATVYQNLELRSADIETAPEANHNCVTTSALIAS